jgi:ABC-type branched-subunit amino acid transport system substrate-binding protein
MERRSWVGLVGLLLVTACTGTAPPATPLLVAPPLQGAAPAAGPPKVAILLPLSGPRADLGAAMLKAAQMALSVPGSPQLDVQDTQGDPAHAQQAAQQALRAGDRIILGPLTAEETVSVAAVSQPAGVPVLAFTSDPAAASGGVWTLGLTPGEQMRRLVLAARDDGRQQIAAVLPEGALGDALQTALTSATSDAGMAAPTIQRSEPGIAGFTDALKIVSNYEARRGELAARMRGLRDQTDPEARVQADALAAKPAQPPPFDALLIGESGPTLEAASGELSGFDVSPPQVRVLGPALWSQQVSRLGRLAGAWYASLDPATRGEFVTAYQAKYGVAPPAIADFAFDAAAIARVLNGENDFSATALTRQEGFSGVDGAMLLLPDGHVHRALAVFQVEAGGTAHIVSPAPQDVSQPAS